MAKKSGGATMLADGHFTFLGETRTDSKKRVVLKGEEGYGWKALLV